MRHLQLKVIPITIQRDNNHQGKVVGPNNLMDLDGSRQETNKEGSGRTKENHGNTSIEKQPLGTTRNCIRLMETRKQLDHMSRFLLY